MADLVTLTIDGQKTTVPKGTLVIDAAADLGIDIPRFCYHPKLSAVGMCRMCLGQVGTPKMGPDRQPVMKEDGTPEIAMMPKPLTLCTTVATQDMLVLTETDDVKKMQRGVMEFLLANHPLDCPVCDKGGECMLQDQAMAYGVGDSRVKEMYYRKKDLAKDFPLGPLITLDQERCIQCARCTRFQDEIAHDHVLGLFNRGSMTLIGTMSDPPFDSKFSGNTIDICPVGALTSREFRFRARIWEMNNVPTVSMADGCGSNIFVSQRNETLDRIFPRTNESINECWISDRDRFGLSYVDRQERLTFPMVRHDGELKPATWDEALQTIIEKLKSTSVERIGAVGGPKLTNEAALAMTTLFKKAIKTPNIDHEWKTTLQTPGRPPENLYEEIENADVILIVGSNPNEELPILDLRIKKAVAQKKAHLINCNPSKTALDALAAQNFHYNSGTEAALVNGLSRAVHQTWSGEPEQSEKIHQIGGQEGAKEWLESLAPFSATKVAESTGIDAGQFQEAGAAIAKAERLIILAGSTLSPPVWRALSNLATLKSRLDYMVILHHDANVQGVRRAGIKPGINGKNGAQILKAGAAGELDILYLAATNPLNGAADGEEALEALRRTPFVVMHSLFLNEISDHADVVLPAASFLEQAGTTTNFHGKVQQLTQVFKPRQRLDSDGYVLSAAAPDWIIFTKLLFLLGHDDVPTSVEGWSNLFTELSPPKPLLSAFAPVSESQDSPVASEGTLRLLYGSLLYDGGESFSYCERLKLAVPAPFAKLHRKDAKSMELQEGDYVEVSGPRGSVKVLAKIGRDVKEGTVWLPWRLRDVRLNMLTANVESTFVNVQKCEAPTELAAAAK
jgi:NADH-quinone oxidoreductase subunit G